jgi:alanyl-tRNA synthetase
LSRQIALPAGDAPAWAAAQIARVTALEKTSQRLAAELARREGRELWMATAPGTDGIRRVTERGAIDDATRARAQAFCAEGRAVFLAVSQDPPAVLLAAAPDCGVHAGERVKAVVTAAGGRGGGNAALAQGSLPPGADFESIVRSLLLT